MIYNINGVSLDLRVEDSQLKINKLDGTKIGSVFVGDEPDTPADAPSTLIEDDIEDEIDEERLPDGWSVSDGELLTDQGVSPYSYSPEK